MQTRANQRQLGLGHFQRRGGVIQILLDTNSFIGYFFDAIIAGFSLLKNRFGAANEIGVFEMAERGLVEVPNPSALFLAEREAGVSGAAVFAGIEGSRPLLIEIQALVGPSPLGTPRRTVVGWDGVRLAMRKPSRPPTPSTSPAVKAISPAIDM